TITMQSSDTTPPALTVPASIKVDATGPAGVIVTYTVSATDPDNTPAEITISCAPVSGSTFSLGAGGTTKTTTVSCTAHDPAGNNSSASFRVTVFGVHDQLVALEGEVNTASGLSRGQRVQLGARLFLADLFYRLGASNAAVNTIESFIRKVGVAPHLTAEQRNQWIAEANQIIAVLGG